MVTTYRVIGAEDVSRIVGLMQSNKIRRTCHAVSGTPKTVSKRSQRKMRSAQTTRRIRTVGRNATETLITWPLSRLDLIQQLHVARFLRVIQKRKRHTLLRIEHVHTRILSFLPMKRGQKSVDDASHIGRRNIISTML